MQNDETIELLTHTVVIDIDDARKKKKYEAIRMGVNAIKAQKVGKWLKHNANYQGTEHVYNCSICAYWQAINTKFCPNCGARMEGQE